MGWVGFSAVIGGRVPLNILYPSPPRGSGRGASPRWRWVFSAVLISGACFFSHRGADGNQLSQGKFVISVVTAVVSISRSSEPLPFHLRPPPLLSFAHVLSHFGSRRVNIFTFSLCLRPSFCPLLMAEARQKAHEFCSCRHLETNYPRHSRSIRNSRNARFPRARYSLVHSMARRCYISLRNKRHRRFWVHPMDDSRLDSR